MFVCNLSIFIVNGSGTATHCYLLMYQRVKPAPTNPSVKRGQSAFSRPRKARRRWVNSLLAFAKQT